MAQGGKGRRGRARRPQGRTRRRRTPLDADRVLGALRAARGPLAVSRIGEALGVSRAAMPQLRKLLTALEQQGRVERVKGRWRMCRDDGLVEAVIAADGEAAQVIDDAGRTWSVEGSSDARPGDRVLARPFGRPGKGVAEVFHVIDGLRDRWVGILERRGGSAWITPYRDDADWAVRVARSDLAGAESGEVVSAVPVERGTGRKRRSRRAAESWARVVERLGRPGDPEADFAAIVWRHRLPVGFPDEVLAEAEALPTQIAPIEQKRRRDLRELPFVTIDPADARDHDDAVCVVPHGRGGARLHVAIADVAHAVAAGGAIDREALRRGNSVYFPERAIPMLPERLSGDVCSLRADTDRRVVAVELTYDAQGRLSGRRFERAVIRSRARLSYEEAAAAVEGDATAHAQGTSLAALGALTRRLRQRRVRAGALDLDLPEPRFAWGPDGRPCDVQRAPRTAAHRAIEEAMLAANRAVAAYLVEADVDAVHRIHEPPAGPEAELLAERLQALGLLEDRHAVLDDSRALGRLLRRAEGHPAERYVHFAVLRSMRQARYAAESRGHFALAFPHYVHFTSPIRRYADLVVHRALLARLDEARPPLSRDRVRRVAARVSFRERLAISAERERADLARCAFLAAHVGERAEGSVTGVARHGLYVTLDAWFVEGLVHVSTLDDYFEIDDLGVALRAQATGERYALGDRVVVRIREVDLVRTRIDFALESVLERASFRGR